MITGTPRSASPTAAAIPAMPPPATTTGLDPSVTVPHPAPPDDGLHAHPGPAASVTSSNDHETPDGLRARKVCRSSLPARRRADLDVDESAPYKRSTKVWIESKDRTLRQR